MHWEIARVLTLLGLAAAAGPQASGDDDFKLSFWEKSVSLRGAIGYKDNVLLSQAQREASPFWLSAADFSLLRAGLDGGPSVTVFVSGEDRRYFSAEGIDKEQLLLSQAKITQEFGNGWTLGGVAQYLYADQVFDASSTEELLETLPVKSHNLQAALIVGRKLGWDLELEARVTGERQIFNRPLDDYWETGPEITLSKRYGHRSVASLSYGYDYRLYDTRLALDLNRTPIPGTPLRFHQHEFEFSLNHSWDKARRWRTRSRALFEASEDSGAGYRDYHRWRFSQRFGYYGSGWNATIEGKLLHYDYRRQPVPGGTAIREAWEYALALHAEKIVWKKLKLFADYEYETSRSNYALEEYTVNTVSAGVDWEF